jgi:excisionase family DNA binding protein
MEVYTLREAARKAKIGMQTLKRACEEGLIKASRLPDRQWRIAESALDEALHKGINLASLPKRAKGRNRNHPRSNAPRRNASASRNMPERFAALIQEGAELLCSFLDGTTSPPV